MKLIVEKHKLSHGLPCKLSCPNGHNPIHFAAFDGAFQVWMVGPTYLSHKVVRTFVIYMDGAPIPEGDYSHVGTTIHGGEAYHCFEILKE